MASIALPPLRSIASALSLARWCGVTAMPNGAVLLLIISWPLFEVSVCLKHKQETFHVFRQDNNRLPAGGLAVLCSAETKVTAGVAMQQIDERLRGEYPQLTPQEQRVADFIFDHFDDLISYNSAELARLSGVSKATVSRLFKRLGYPSYRAMRDELRTLRQSGMPLTDNRDAVQGNTLLARHYKQEMANLTQWVNHIDAEQFNAVIAALVQARRVVLIWHRRPLLVRRVTAVQSASPASAMAGSVSTLALACTLTTSSARIQRQMSKSWISMSLKMPPERLM
ncbi:putative DNA-binding transcriptional regulator [compost metagenome]